MGPFDTDTVETSQRVTALLEAVRALGAATTEGEVLSAVALEGARALGASATAICLPDAARPVVRTLVASSGQGPGGPAVRVDVIDLPTDHPLPVLRSALTGQAWFLQDRSAAAAALPEARELYESSRTQASAVLPLEVGERLLGAVGLAFDEVRAWHPADRELVEALAALTAQALDRLAALEAERTAQAEVHRVLDALRTSLAPALPRPPVPGLDVAVVSRPVAQDLRLGGDWADALPEGDGVVLVLGDVVGHDGVAAVAVAQARGALRGALQVFRSSSPASLLRAVDGVLSAPDVDVLATAVVCRLERTGPGPAPWRLRWATAGHLPPLLRLPDRRVEALTPGGDLLLGLADRGGGHRSWHVGRRVGAGWGAGAQGWRDDGGLRADHARRVPPGSVLLLFSDGVLERRGQNLLERQRALSALLSAAGASSAEALCERVVAEMGDGSEDDVTVLAAALS